MNLRTLLCFLCLIVAIKWLPILSSGSFTRDSTQLVGKSAFTIDQIMNIVAKSRLEKCLLKVICDLSADLSNKNEHSMGTSGTRFMKALAKLEQSGHAKVIPYRLAHQLGKKSKSRDECLKKYYGCRITPSIVVKMANNLIAV